MRLLLLLFAKFLLALRPTAYTPKQETIYDHCPSDGVAESNVR